MSSQPPLLCDRTTLLRNRARACEDAMFLHQEALTDVKDRLSLVNKSFPHRAIVTGHTAFWENAFPNAAVIHDDDTLALKHEAYDLVVHMMAMHWANDPVGQLIQCRRALRPDGLFLAMFFGGDTLNELRSCLAEAEISVRGGLSPRVAPMGDLRDLGALLQRAGFALPVADSCKVRSEYDSIAALGRDLRGMGEANALATRDRRTSPRKVFELADAIYREQFPGEQKAIRATFEVITLTGWAPSESQPKPLRPGSATTRLADALGTKESPLRN